VPPPQTNCTVTRVAGAGVGDDWDRNEGGAAGPEKWAGEERAYFRRARDRQFDGGRVDVVKRDELVIEVAWVLRTGVDTDDVVTFVLDEAPDTPLEASPQVIPIKTLAGVPAGLQTSRIALQQAAAVEE
jgi:hypothetical protein